MQFWIYLWTAVFALTILVYSCLVVVVGFGGWSDIKAMFKTLDEQSKEPDQ